MQHLLQLHIHLTLTLEIFFISVGERAFFFSRNPPTLFSKSAESWWVANTFLQLQSRLRYSILLPARWTSWLINLIVLLLRYAYLLKDYRSIYL